LRPKISKPSVRQVRTATSCLRCWPDGSVAEMLGGDLLRHHHAPRVEHDLARFVLVDLVESYDDPVVAHVRLAWHQKLVGLGRNEGLALFLREGEAHHRLV